MESSISTLTNTYNKAAIKANLEEILKFITENNVKNPKLTQRSLYLYERKKGFTKSKDLTCRIDIPYTELKKAEKLTEAAESYPNIVKFLKINCSVKVGDEFYPIEQADRPVGEEDLTISHKSGTVLIIDFWATWCEGCQDPMVHSQALLVKNKEKWKDRVRIVSASIDSNRKDLANFIQERGWNEIDHYILPGGWNHPACLAYGIQKIPHIAVVNKQGRIVYSGNPFGFNAATEIDKLLGQPDTPSLKDSEESKDAGTGSKIKEEGVSKEVYSQVRELIKNGKFASLIELSQQRGVFESYIVIQHIKELDLELRVTQISRARLIAGGTMTPKFAEEFRKEFAKITSNVPSEDSYCHARVLNTIKINRGESCSSCSIQLSLKEAQYLSYQDGKYFCKKCGEYENPDKYGVDKFLSPHALIYIGGNDPTSLEEIVEARIGDQNQPKTLQEEEKYKIHNGLLCDACKKEINATVRYKCLNCLRVNICGACNAKMTQGDITLYNELKENCRHDHAAHVLQRFHFSEQ